ncbi:transposase domain-containing protein [Ligilactobacillus ruminis]|uniref:transposase domain-containing protein n=1 Tax=Ligilactobacillus ruminis TaxID=1623 RepID=UPI0022E5BA1E|nr:transposase domain-containing protein [Ligilactobacillus ruminis]
MPDEKCFCTECSSDDHSKISRAPMPRSLISHSKTGSPSIAAFTHSDGSSSSTAKLNQLDPEKYLRKVLTEITNIEAFDPERFRHLLPWNLELVS